ncbi:hypothetical protein [Pseudomonas kurunegalensis]|uniref:hypothetical protein n=1 Tax=Pseudomonas kurunegalensis TaxID=485880 RepID=UPI0025711A15|nr:hypothetical protein [Pseudomonas kurunegalensis]WJD63701.1 hypothetical protein QQ992_05235 [Pseudomonas kurunegalensis]
MKKHTDRSMLLTLTEQEGKTLRDIIKPENEGPERMLLSRRVFYGLSAVLFFALVVLGMARLDVAMAIIELANRFLTLWL